MRKLRNLIKIIIIIIILLFALIGFLVNRRQDIQNEQGDENALSIEDIKAARVLRDSKIKNLKKPEATRPSSFSARPTAAPAHSGASKGAANKVDFDF